MDRRDFIKLSGISILASSTNILAMEILEKEEKPKSGDNKMKVIKLQPKDHLKPKRSCRNIGWANWGSFWSSLQWLCSKIQWNSREVSI